jgi:membrane protein YdbS with pleckstrin-like domain
MLNKRFNIFNIGLLFVLISPIFWFWSWYYIMKISNYKKWMFAIWFIISTILTIVLWFITANYENKKEQEERDLQFKKNEIMQQQKLMNEINALKNNQ